jgi:hypothetical protein
MSSGNRFVCGMRRFDKHKLSSDKPNSLSLYNESEQRLNQLLREREQIYTNVHPQQPPIQSNSFKSSQQNNEKREEVNVYTPWKTPSSSSK